MAEKEYIEREAAYPLAKKICDAIDSEDFQRLNFGMRILDWIDGLPAAEVWPVVRATWRRYSPFTDTYECSNCGEQVIDQQFRTNFCPNCGAMMEES